MIQFSHELGLLPTASAVERLRTLVDLFLDPKSTILRQSLQERIHDTNAFNLTLSLHVF